jgi:hypothetical protein
MRVPKERRAPDRSPSYDTEVARLTARADLVVEELDIVVKQLSEMLKSAYGIKND